jgi:formate dehydrogenase major subunit
MVRLIIDGTAFEAAEGTLLIAALAAVGVAVAHLCHDKRLKPSGACRLCVVEVEGQARPVASCSFEVAEGMAVRTRSEALEALRRTNLELIAAHYPLAAYAAEPHHPFHRLLSEYGCVRGAWRRRGCFRTTAIPTSAWRWTAAFIASVAYAFGCAAFAEMNGP